MCIVFIVISGFLAVSFYSNNQLLFALGSVLVSLVLLSFFVRNLITNSPCLFGKRTDCRK